MTKPSESITVYAKRDGTAPLTLTKIGDGGQGDVYTQTLDDGTTEVACKIFNARQESAELARKIHRMVEIGNANDQELIKHKQIAWPQLVIYNQKGEFIGYAMKKAQGQPLTLLAHHENATEKFPDIDRGKVAKMLIRVWETAEFLHNRKIFIGDVNPGNFLCTSDYRPCLIDTDSYQLEGWKCLVGRPEMTPPEHLDKAYPDVKRTRESDLYSLAILSFQCLMLGKHPYEHIGHGTPLENQRMGRMPYLKGAGAAPGMAGGVPLGPWYVYWSHYPHNIKNLFDRALREGAENPSRRPGASEWVRGLRSFVELLKKPHSKTQDGKPFQHALQMKPTEPKPRNMTRLSPAELAVVEPIIPTSVASAPIAKPAATVASSWGDLMGNPTPRIVCSLVIDTSANMAGRMDELNADIRAFIEKIGKDDFARFSVGVEAFACGGNVSRFSTQRGDTWRDFTAGGDARIGAGLAQAIDVTKNLQHDFAAAGISSYRPWLVLLTASDPADDCTAAVTELTRMGLNDRIAVFPVGIGAGYNPANFAELTRISNRSFERVGDGKFTDFFDWLAKCMSTVSMSVPGYRWDLPPRDSWAAK